MFTNTTLAVIGGTGSFGNAVIQRFLQSGIAQILVFSRDEKKQDDMRKLYRSDKLEFHLGDVRDAASVRDSLRGVDYVFNAAALKQVPSCEFFPMQAVATNVIGTNNVIDACIHQGVKRLVCLSTDKAVYPINAMGISKAMMEKVMVARARDLRGSPTVICGTRYGNVMASRGSVIPLFMDQMARGIPITITDPSMTRFMMTLDGAVDLVLFAFSNGRPGDIFVQKSPAATLTTLVRALTQVIGSPTHPTSIIGTRHGEKRFETLCSREEMAVAVDLGAYYRIPADMRGLDYESYFAAGSRAITAANDYNSDNTHQLDVAAMQQLLLEIREVKERASAGAAALVG